MFFVYQNECAKTQELFEITFQLLISASDLDITSQNVVMTKELNMVDRSVEPHLSF